MNEELDITQIEQKPAQPRILTLTARLISAVFTPFMVPLIGYFLLFFFTYLSILPLKFRLYMLLVICSFTILFPMVSIYLFQVLSGRKIKHLSHREHRYTPYLLTIISHCACVITLFRIHVPYYLTSILIATILCIVLCFLINFKWKISTHMASCGLLIGGLLSYSFIFQFNPLNWLCYLIMLTGILGTARIIVTQHSLLEVTAGFVVGMFCGISGILFI